MTDWQQIETAPKDGTRILLCWEGHPTLAAHVELGWFGRAGVFCNTYGKAFSGKPTHWMPLPPPPETSK